MPAGINRKTKRVSEAGARSGTQYFPPSDSAVDEFIPIPRRKLLNPRTSAVRCTQESTEPHACSLAAFVPISALPPSKVSRKGSRKSCEVTDHGAEFLRILVQCAVFELIYSPTRNSESFPRASLQRLRTLPNRG